MGILDKSERREVSAAVVGVELKVFARRKWPLTNDEDRQRRLRGVLAFTGRRIKSLWDGEKTAVVHTHETDAVEGAHRTQDRRGGRQGECG